jgi:hypothetical protein
MKCPSCKKESHFIVKSYTTIEQLYKPNLEETKQWSNGIITNGSRYVIGVTCNRCNNMLRKDQIKEIGLIVYGAKFERKSVITRAERTGKILYSVNSTWHGAIKQNYLSLREPGEDHGDDFDFKEDTLDGSTENETVEFVEAYCYECDIICENLCKCEDDGRPFCYKHGNIKHMLCNECVDEMTCMKCGNISDELLLYCMEKDQDICEKCVDDHQEYCNCELQ